MGCGSSVAASAASRDRSAPLRYSAVGLPISATGRKADGVAPVDRAAFKELHVIGQGGFGRVTAVEKNRGFDKGTVYALKTVEKAAVIRRKHVSMVMRERSLHARLHCPQLVNLHYAFQDGVWGREGA